MRGFTSIQQKHDRKVLERTNELIKNAMRNHFTGLDKPESLKCNLKGWWSRRITREHRLIYRVEDGMLVMLQCRFHCDK